MNIIQTIHGKEDQSSQQIKGWEDKNEAETYSAFYSKMAQPKILQTHPSKMETFTSKSTGKGHLKFASNSITKQRRCAKLLTDIKYRQPWQLHNEKNTFLQYLRKQPSNSKLKEQEPQLKTPQYAQLKQQQNSFAFTTATFYRPLKQIEIRHNTEIPRGPPNFKELFSKFSPIKKQSRRPFYLKAASFCSSKKLPQKRQKPRAEVDLKLKAELKISESVKNNLNSHKKTTYFPLFYRQLQQKMQTSQKRPSVAKYHLKSHKKNYKSQFFMPRQQNQQYSEQFIDANLLPSNKKP